MPLTLEQLRTTISESEALADLITTAQSLGFNATAWQSGSVQRALLQLMSTVWSDMTARVNSLSYFSFNNTATGGALTALALSHYANTRTAAGQTSGTVTLTGAAVGPPWVVAAGDVIVADSTGRQFRSTTGGTVPASGTLDITVQADIAGSDGNVANGTLTVMVTPLAGVTSNNPDPGTGTWITTLGTDAETDAALAARNTAKWGVLSPSDPDARYEYYIRTAVANAARVESDSSNPGGPGTLYIYIASSTGVSSAADVTAAQTEADRIRNPTAAVTVFAADAQSQDFTFTAYVQAAYNTASTQAAIVQALTDYVNGLPIGGSVFPDAIPGIFVRSEALDAMTSITGVDRVDMTTPAGNVTITAHDVMTVGAVSATYTSI